MRVCPVTFAGTMGKQALSHPESMSWWDACGGQWGPLCCTHTHINTHPGGHVCLGVKPPREENRLEKQRGTTSCQHHLSTWIDQTRVVCVSASPLSGRFPRSLCAAVGVRLSPFLCRSTGPCVADRVVWSPPSKDGHLGCLSSSYVSCCCGPLQASLCAAPPTLPLMRP